jgi:hypothetical protein
MTFVRVSVNSYKYWPLDGMGVPLAQLIGLICICHQMTWAFPWRNKSEKYPTTHEPLMLQQQNF